MNTITIYITTEDLVAKMTLIETLSQLTTIQQIEQIKPYHKVFNVYLTNKYSNRVAFNINFSTFSLLSIFIGRNLLTD